jgi:aminoglycoside phosphotransferase (APT) family kinase protein
MRALSPSQRSWLAAATGLAPASLHLAPLDGGTSTTVLAVLGRRGAVSTPARRAPSFVLRLFDNVRWLAQEPDLLAHEVAALTEARRAGLPVPQVIAQVAGGEPFEAPALLMTHLPGRVELQPSGRWTRLLASTLVAVHAHAASGFGWRYRSWVFDRGVAVPPWTERTRLWEAAVMAHAAFRAKRDGGDAGRATFVHRDYHPLNLLFAGSGDEAVVSGVVDWVNACLGPAAADVSHCRMNLAMLHGADLADEFLAAYADELGGYDYDPAWDVEVAFDMAAPTLSFYRPWTRFGVRAPSESALRGRVDEFVSRALTRAGGHLV